MGYDSKKGKDRTVRETQHRERATLDYSGKWVCRLPEKRDYNYGKDDSDPVSDYYSIRNSNRRFFRMKSSDKIDLSAFDKTNYLTSPKVAAGTTR